MTYLIASLIIILINVVPAFMPPTWTIISYVYIIHDVNLLLLSVIGAVSSSIGRFLLARFSNLFSSSYFKGYFKENMHYVGMKIRGSHFRMFTIAFIWAISPIASNPLFIAAGLASRKIGSLLSGFFLGRSLSYFFLAYTAKIVVENFNDIFYGSVLDIRKIIVNAIGIFLIFIYVFIDWKELFVNKRIRFYFGCLTREQKK